MSDTVIITEQDTVVVTAETIQVVSVATQGPPGATGATGATGPAGADVNLSVGHMLVVDAVNGDDDSGTRGKLDKPFQTLTAAKAAAQSGDIIVVYPGAYTCSASLAKHLVNWDFDAGVSVTMTADSSVGVWDDGGTAMTFTVRGAGVFTRLRATPDGGSNLRNVNSSHVSSVIDVEGLDFICGAPGESGGDKAISCAAGRLRVRFRDALAYGDTGAAVWWGNGELDAVGRRAYGVAAGVWSEVTATPTAEADCRIARVEADAYAVYDTSTQATAWLGVVAEILKGQSAVAVGGAKVYVHCQKAFAPLQINGGLLYFFADKVSPSDGSAQLYTASGGTAFIRVAHWDGVGTGTSVFDISAGTHHITGGEYVAPAAGSGLTVSGGTVYLDGLRIDTSVAVAHGITVTGGTVHLAGSVITSTPPAKDLVQSGSGTVVVHPGCWGTNANGSFTTSGTITYTPQRVDAAASPTFAGVSAPATGSQTFTITANGITMMTFTGVGNFIQVNTDDTMWNVSKFRLGSGTAFGWSSNSVPTGAANDTGLVRSSAGTVKVTNGSTGFGTTSALSFIAYESAGVKNVALAHNGTDATLTASSGDLILDSSGSSGISFRRLGVQAANLRTNDGTLLLNGGFFVGGNTARYDSGGVGFGSTSAVIWSSAANRYDLPDTGIARAAAGVVKLTNGSTGAGTLSSPALSPTALSADQNNYNPGTARYLRLATNGSGARALTGLVAGVDGQELAIINVSASDTITLKHQSGSSTSANQFLNVTGADIVLTANGRADLVYDGTTACWRVY